MAGKFFGYLVSFVCLWVMFKYLLQAMSIGDIWAVVFVLVVGTAFISYRFKIPLVSRFFRAVVAGFGFLLVGVAKIISLPFSGSREAKFMNLVDRKLLLNNFHQGFLVDGKKSRLSQKKSFQSVVTVGGSGKGKSTVHGIPNLCTLDDCSMVVTDTSGEIYRDTSGYLKKKGFKIKVLNLMEIGKGETYNPLVNANSYTEIQQVANVIIKSALEGDQDPFWSAGAEKIIKIFIQCLKNRGEPEHCTLSNVKYLLSNFDTLLHRRGDEPGVIDKFVLEHTANDPSTYNDYKGFTTGNDKTVSSFISTADTALSAIGNPELAHLTGSNTLDFQQLREEKTVLYVMVRQQDLKFYSFLLNLFYTDLFGFLLKDLNNTKLPVYLLLDEFGHLTIPGFDVFATTARKYKVGFWAFLQSLSQLESRYGRKEAETILDGLQNELYFGGVGLDTAKMLERRLGKKRDKKGYPVNLMNEDEIIKMKDEQVLFFHSNKEPVKLKVKPFYKQRRFTKLTKIPPVDFSEFDVNRSLEYVPLSSEGRSQEEENGREEDFQESEQDRADFKEEAHFW